MKRSTVLILLLLFALQCSLLAAADAKITVEDVCRKAGSGYVDEGFCLQAFNSDPRSRTADEWGLLSIALNLSIANATSTASKLKYLMDHEPDVFGVGTTLQACFYIYLNSESALRSSLDFAASKDIKTSVALLNAVQLNPMYCEKALPKGKATKENADFGNLVMLATAITTFFRIPPTI